MKKTTDIMAHDTLYVVYTFGITAVLYFLGASMAYHG